jgi:hypothetical protein
VSGQVFDHQKLFRVLIKAQENVNYAQGSFFFAIRNLPLDLRKSWTTKAIRHATGGSVLPAAP